MIEATAQENKRALEDWRAPQNEGATDLIIGMGYASDGLASHRRRLRPLILCITGLIVASTVGSLVFASKVSERRPSALAADSDLERKSPVVGSANTTGEPVARVLPTGQPDSTGTVGVEEKLTDEGTGNGGMPAASSDERTITTPPQPPAEVLPSDPIAPARDIVGDQPLPPQAPSSPQPASETGSTIDRAKDHPVATHIASTISDVRMRAGPGNGETVLATIPRGRPVEVIECRQWCEVIFAGQRGWVYKSFIGPPSIARRP